MRRARNLMAVVTSVALVGAGSLLMATPANAATVAADCPVGGTTVEIDPVPSSTLTVTGISDCTTIYVGTTTVDQSSDVSFPAGTTFRAGDPLTVGSSYEWSSIVWAGTDLDVVLATNVPTTPGATLLFGNASGGRFFYVKVRSASPSPSPQPSSNTATSAPTAWIQQFGMPASGSCEDAAPADLNTAGVGSGGWGTSWAQWMNGGTGGVVCTRTLSYVGSSWTAS